MGPSPILAVNTTDNRFSSDVAVLKPTGRKQGPLTDSPEGLQSSATRAQEANAVTQPTTPLGQTTTPESLPIEANREKLKPSSGVTVSNAKDKDKLQRQIERLKLEVAQLEARQTAIAPTKRTGSNEDDADEEERKEIKDIEEQLQNLSKVLYCSLQWLV